MDWVIIVVASFLGTLGVITMLSQIVKELNFPKKWGTVDESRRSFLLLLTSVLVGLVSGSWMYQKAKMRKILIPILYDLEVKLVQMEGLILAALSDTSPLRSLQLLDKFLGYLDKYKQQVARILQDISKVHHSIHEELNEHLNTLIKAREGIDIRKLDKNYTDSLQSMLEEIGQMRSAVKREIFGLGKQNDL